VNAITDRTPADDGFAMPAEWTPHEATLIAWPTRSRPELWGDLFADAQREYATVANAIAAFEPVLMIVEPDQRSEARAFLSSDVELVPLPIDDSWVRDSGPIVVTDDAGGRALVDFRFNGWGGRFADYDRDAVVAEALLNHLEMRRYDASIVFEGGAPITTSWPRTSATVFITHPAALRGASRLPAAAHGPRPATVLRRSNCPSAAGPPACHARHGPRARSCRAARPDSPAA